MNWKLTDRADEPSRLIADRHYNRQKPGTPQFVPPGRCMVLISTDGLSLWVTSWPFAEYVRHAWPGAWMNSAFRREGGELASTLIREAIACTRWYYGEPPELGMVTFVDESKVRHKRDVGRCYRRAGFKHVGFTKGGLWAFQLLPTDMPEPEPPIDGQIGFFDTLPRDAVSGQRDPA